MTWKENIEYEMGIHQEEWKDIIRFNGNRDILEYEDNELRSEPDIWGKGFTIWTRSRVYFPYMTKSLQGDDLVFTGSVPRDPCGEISDFTENEE